MGYDPWCSKKPQYWHTHFSLYEINRKLRKSYGHIGKLKTIIPLSSSSKHISKVKLITTTQTITLKVNDLRLMLGPAKIRSSFFQMEQKGNTIYFSGKGFGHGVGLSQWGAYYMAKAGRDYRDILNFYYKNIVIKPIEEINFSLITYQN